FGGSSAALTGTFSGKARVDSGNPGRYTLFIGDSNPFKIKAAGTTMSYDVVLYQGSGNQLFWVNVNQDDISLFLGSLQQMESLAGLPTARKTEAKPGTQP